MKIKFKILSIIACFAILLSVISLSVFAEAPYDYPPYDEIVTDGLSNVTYGTIANYESYMVQVGSVIPYSFFKNLFLSYGGGKLGDSNDKMLFNIFCDVGGKLRPMFTTEYALSLQIYTWNKPYNNYDGNIAICGGTGSSKIWVNLSNKPKFTITQDSDGYIYFKQNESVWLKSTIKYTTGNLFLMYAVGLDDYNGLITDCQTYFNNESFIENEGMYGATADFITFPKTSNNLGLLPVYLKSWLGDGYQYPYLEFYIDANTHKQTYTLTISSFDYDIYDRQIGKPFNNGKGSIKLDKYCEPFYTTGNLSNDLKNISNALDLVPDVSVNPAWTSDRLAEFNRDIITFEIKNKLKTNVSFTDSVSISTESLNFTGSDDIVRYYSICLSDYLDISHKKIYRVDISNGSNILATTYFSSYDSFLRNATPVGDSHSVGYTDKSTFHNDANNGTYVSGTRTDLNAFNNNDTPSISPNTNLYNNIGNGDFFSALDSTLKGLQGFFYGCYAIIPPAIISIILGSLAIIVVMRVLGR